MASKRFAKMLDDRCRLSKAIWIQLQDQLKRVRTTSWVFESFLLRELRVAHLCFFQRSKKQEERINNQSLVLDFLLTKREVVLDILLMKCPDRDSGHEKLCVGKGTTGLYTAHTGSRPLQIIKINTDSLSKLPFVAILVPMNPGEEPLNLFRLSKIKQNSNAPSQPIWAKMLSGSIPQCPKVLLRQIRTLT